MNYTANNTEKDFVTIAGGDYPIHYLMFSGEVYQAQSELRIPETTD